MKKSTALILALQFTYVLIYALIGQYKNLNTEIEIYWLLILPLYCMYGYVVYAISNHHLSLKKLFSALLIFLPNWSWISLTFLIQLSYYVLNNYIRSGIWEESTWVLLA